MKNLNKLKRGFADDIENMPKDGKEDKEDDGDDNE